MKAQDILPPFLEAAKRHTAVLNDFRQKLRKEWTEPPVNRNKSHRWWSADDVVAQRRKKVKAINQLAWRHNASLPDRGFGRHQRHDISLESELEKVYQEFPPGGS